MGGQGCHISCDTHVGLASKLFSFNEYDFFGEAFFVLLLRDKTEGSYPLLILILITYFLTNPKLNSN